MKPNQLSNTAAFIAVKFYGLTREEPFRSLFNEEVVRFYERLVKRLPAPIHYYHRGLKHASLRTFFTFWEELLLPGDLMHIILRKWYLTQWVEALRQSGYIQMLVLGAGFDHLATLNADTEMYSVELDAPYMAMTKRSFIDQHDYNHPQLKIIDSFFTRDALTQTLSTKTELDPRKKTIIIAEGFFDYFSAENSSAYLNELNNFFKNEITLLSTLFSLEELPPFRSFVYRNSIRLASEKLKLGLGRDDYLSLLQNHAFELEQIINSSQMKEEVLAPNKISYPVLDGFYLIKAKRDGK